jgi:tetratricopeptide (TPR) repeat protein
MPPEPDYFIPHAHNLEVQSLAELGLVGVAAAIVLVGSIASLLISAARGAERDRRWWAWATGIGLTYFVLHQVLDFYVNMPAFLFAAALPIAYLDATAPAQPRLDSALTRLAPSRRWVAVSFGSIVAVAVVGLLAQEVPALRQDLAVALATDGDWAAADTPAREAAAMDPDIGSYQLTAGLTASRAGDHDAAAAYFRKVAGRDDLPEAWLNLAAEQETLGDHADAAASLDRALRLGYQRVAITVAAADLAQRLGNTDLAVDLLATAIIRQPTLAGDPWWQTEPARANVRAAAVERALSLNGDWSIALAAGEAERARMLAGPADAFASTVISAWEDDALAGPLLDGCQTYALDLSWLAWCAKVEVQHGHLDAADVYRQRVSLINLGAALEAGLMRVSPTGMLGRQLVGDPADLWATYTYRRPAPWDILVPSLVHLTLE